MDYWAYFGLIIWPWLTVAGVIVLFYAFVCGCVCYHHGKKIIIECQAGILKHFFHIIRNEDDHRDIEIFSTFLLLLMLIITSAATFFYLLLEETSHCETRLDCFPFSNKDIGPLQSHPIENCSDWEPPNFNGSVTIRCYGIGWNVAVAVGNTGGILYLSIFMLKLITSVVSWLSDYNILGSIVVFIAVITFLLFPGTAFSTLWLHTPHVGIQLILYFLIFEAALIMSFIIHHGICC